LRDLLRQKEVLLQEMQHRVANNLQIIASILLIKARTVRSVETRQHLQDAHQRILSVAAIQQQLQTSDSGAMIEIAPYLSRLCQTLTASMIGDSRPIALKVDIQGGTASSSQAVSIGIIVTELVINASMHSPVTEKITSWLLLMIWPHRTGDFRFPTTELANRKATWIGQFLGWVRPSSKRWQSNLMPEQKS